MCSSLDVPFCFIEASLLPDQVAAPSGGYLRAEAGESWPPKLNHADFRSRGPWMLQAEQASRASTPAKERPCKSIQEPDSAAKETAAVLLQMDCYLCTAVTLIRCAAGPSILSRLRK